MQGTARRAQAGRMCLLKTMRTSDTTLDIRRRIVRNVMRFVAFFGNDEDLALLSSSEMRQFEL